MRLSIITVNKNNANGLERTIQSVINQTFKDFEYIIIDGASIDNSVEVIKKFADKINYWVSEPDKGIYNAMNKGIEVAQGEYLLFLNSGDYLADNYVLENIFFSIDKDFDIIYGNLNIDKTRIARYPSKLTLKYFIKSTLPHPGSLFKRKLFSEIGLYNEKYVIASDYEFFLKAIIVNNCSYKHLDFTFSVFFKDGISSKQVDLSIKERDEILKELFPNIYEDYIYFMDIEHKYNLLLSSRLIRLIRKFQNSRFYSLLKKK